MVLIFPPPDGMTLDIHHEHPWRRVYGTIYQKVFYKFFEMSPIHTASFVALRRSAWEGYFWLLIMIVFFALCIRDIVDLTTTYLAIPTGISIEVMNNYTMTYENVAICIDIFRATVLQTVADGFDEMQFNQTLAELKMLAPNPASFDLSTLNITDVNWDLLIKTTYLMLSSFTDYEMQVFSALYDPVSIRAVQLAQAFYVANGFSMFALVQQVGKFMCLQTLDPNANVQANGQPCPYAYTMAAGTTCIQVCGSVSTVIWLGYSPSNWQDDICLKQSSPGSWGITFFENPEDMFVITQIHPSRPSVSPAVWGNETLAIPFATAYGAPEVWFDLRSGDGIIDVHYVDSAYWQSDGSSAYVGLEVITTAQAYNKSTTPCFDFSEVTCAETCIVAKWAGSNCWPISGQAVPGRPANAKPCMNAYPGYNISGAPLNYFGACIFGCGQRHCASTCYQYRVSPFTMVATTGVPDPLYGTNITIYQARFIYPAFTESPSMNLAAFLAAFGGSLGLWLGGSIVALIHIPMFTVSAAHRIHTYNKKKKSTTPEKMHDLHDTEDQLKDTENISPSLPVPYSTLVVKPAVMGAAPPTVPSGIYDDQQFRMEHIRVVFADSR